MMKNGLVLFLAVFSFSNSLWAFKVNTTVNGIFTVITVSPKDKYEIIKTGDIDKVYNSYNLGWGFKNPTAKLRRYLRDKYNPKFLLAFSVSGGLRVSVSSKNTDPRRIHYLKDKSGNYIKVADTVGARWDWGKGRVQDITPPDISKSDNYDWQNGIFAWIEGDGWKLIPYFQNTQYYTEATNRGYSINTLSVKDNWVDNYDALNDTWKDKKIFWGFQNGMMLLYEGIRLTNANSTNKTTRVAVGFKDNGELVFISSAPVPVSFNELAVAFQKQGVRNAIFLEGAVDEMYYLDETKGPDYCAIAGYEEENTQEDSDMIMIQLYE